MAFPKLFRPELEGLEIYRLAMVQAYGTHGRARLPKYDGGHVWQSMMMEKLKAE